MKIPKSLRTFAADRLEQLSNYVAENNKGLRFDISIAVPYETYPDMGMERLRTLHDSNMRRLRIEFPPVPRIQHGMVQEQSHWVEWELRFMKGDWHVHCVGMSNGMPSLHALKGFKQTITVCDRFSNWFINEPPLPTRQLELAL